MVWDVGDANATHFIDYYEVAQKIRVGFPEQSHSAIRHNIDHKGSTQCVCVCHRLLFYSKCTGFTVCFHL